MHTIELYKANGSWVAVFSDPAVAEVMGAPAVATPYLDTAPAADVLRAIQRLNPDCIVSLRNI
jgi:hypothetical protein